MLYTFSNLSKEKTSVGGKAYMLAMMTQLGIKVPDGLIVDELPNEDELKTILKFANDSSFTMAVRSSATGEDSKENSFAGQNSTFLYVDNDEDLKYSIKNCFDSIHKESSKAYRKHFLGSESEVPMNVVIQEMIDPSFSGVYFSKDPRGIKEGWLLEYIDGVGEDLVSGKRTPKSLSEDNFTSTELSNDQVTQIVEYAKIVEKEYNDEFDIEWAIDKEGCVYILQARPITAKASLSQMTKVANDELKRLKKEFDEDSFWDGQTFSEWTTAPTTFTSSLWEDSFKKNEAFDKALKELGYLGLNALQKDESLLDVVFGKCYINLKKLGSAYFGPIPYSIEPLPRPHLKFKLSKISPEVVLKTPLTIYRMLKVGLSINTRRKEFIEKAKEELINASTLLERPNNPLMYSDWDERKVDERLSKESALFANRTLVWPYILITLTETTMQTLIALLKSVYDEKKAVELVKNWSGQGINSETFKMGQYFKKACAYPESRELFMQRYGHRGPGELDLGSKRWVEIGEDAFYDMDPKEYQKSKDSHSLIDVEAQIEEMKTFKKSIILEEWKLLKSLLELREKWKLALLRPYCHIRFLLIEKAKRLEGIEIDDIFWLKLEEILHYEPSMALLINERKEKAKQFQNYNFSSVTSLKEIVDVIENNKKDEGDLSGIGLSSGLIKGKVVVINNPSSWKKIDWPENPVIVAQSTDPGWTPIFTKAKGIIVERGGVLSHCAIVAREMGIPAVSGIKQCHNKFKGGEDVWIDGNSGTVKLI